MSAPIKMTQGYFSEVIKLDLFAFTTGHPLDGLKTYNEWLKLFLDWQNYSADNASLNPQYKTAVINSQITEVD